jgi:sterol desaturase/sphingolipid hydroxylase (fatty acid hydroxylase superfamily)
MLGIPIGLAVSNMAEWLIHKHVLHGLGRVRRSFWSFHWHEHHRNARTHGFVDPDYDRSVLAWNAQGKEAFGLVGMALLVTPLLPVAPFFVLTSYYTSYRYYRVHKRAHQDPEWARAHVPWHYDHHMGPNQDANWCVTNPWFDTVMGTREPYVGTEKERTARDKRRAPRYAA